MDNCDVVFYDNGSGELMKLVNFGGFSGWIMYQPGTPGEWEPLRRATEDDRKRIEIGQHGLPVMLKAPTP